MRLKDYIRVLSDPKYFLYKEDSYSLHGTVKKVYNDTKDLVPQTVIDKSVDKQTSDRLINLLNGVNNRLKSNLEYLNKNVQTSLRIYDDTKGKIDLYKYDSQGNSTKIFEQNEYYGLMNTLSPIFSQYSGSYFVLNNGFIYAMEQFINRNIGQSTIIQQNQSKTNTQQDILVSIELLNYFKSKNFLTDVLNYYKKNYKTTDYKNINSYFAKPDSTFKNISKFMCTEVNSVYYGLSLAKPYSAILTAIGNNTNLPTISTIKGSTKHVSNQFYKIFENFPPFLINIVTGSSIYESCLDDLTTCVDLYNKLVFENDKLKDGIRKAESVLLKIHESDFKNFEKTIVKKQVTPVPTGSFNTYTNFKDSNSNIFTESTLINLNIIQPKFKISSSISGAANDDIYKYGDIINGIPDFNKKGIPTQLPTTTSEYLYRDTYADIDVFGYDIRDQYTESKCLFDTTTVIKVPSVDSFCFLNKLSNEHVYVQQASKYDEMLFKLDNSHLMKLSKTGMNFLCEQAFIRTSKFNNTGAIGGWTYFNHEFTTDVDKIEFLHSSGTEFTIDYDINIFADKILIGIQGKNDETTKYDNFFDAINEKDKLYKDSFNIFTDKGIGYNKYDNSVKDVFSSSTQLQGLIESYKHSLIKDEYDAKDFVQPIDWKYENIYQFEIDFKSVLQCVFDIKNLMHQYKLKGEFLRGVAPCFAGVKNILRKENADIFVNDFIIDQITQAETKLLLEDFIIIAGKLSDEEYNLFKPYEKVNLKTVIVTIGTTTSDLLETVSNFLVFLFIRSLFVRFTWNSVNEKRIKLLTDNFIPTYELSLGTILRDAVNNSIGGFNSFIKNQASTPPVIPGNQIAETKLNNSLQKILTSIDNLLN